MTPDPDRFPPQKCGLCGALLAPVPTPDGNWELICENRKCPRSREEIEEEDELEEP